MNIKPISPPTPDAESEPFWDAARQGRFLLRQCNACGEVHWFPRTICPFCWSGETIWVAGTGRGTIYSWTVMRRAKTPYAVAYVELEEGPRMLTNIVDCDLESLSIGMAVELVFAATTDPLSPPVPMFRPAASAPLG